MPESLILAEEEEEKHYHTVQLTRRPDCRPTDSTRTQTLSNTRRPGGADPSGWP